MQQLHQLSLIKTRYHLTANGKHRHEILPGNSHHLICPLPIVSNVIFYIRDAVLCKKPLGLFAGGSGGQGIDCYLFIS